MSSSRTSSGTLRPVRDEQTSDLLRSTLLVAVPLRVLGLYEQGGPDPAAIERAQVFGKTLAEQADRLLFRTANKGATARLFNELAHAVAVLSFAPGGVPLLFGERWEAKTILAGFFGKEVADAYCRDVTLRYETERVEVWAACSLLSQQQDLYLVEISSHLQMLTPQALSQLHQEHYTNLTVAPDGCPMTHREHITSQVLVLLAAEDEQVATLIAQAIQQREGLPVCRLNKEQVQAWIAVCRLVWPSESKEANDAL